LKNLKKTFIVLLLNFLIINCKNSPTNENWNPDEIIAVGKTKDTTYLWCSITVYEEEYSYRTGTWNFLTKDSVKIANGEYDIFLNEIWDKGGCPYKYMENEIDLNKWEFWNLSGEKIEATEKMIKLIDYKVKEITTEE